MRKLQLSKHIAVQCLFIFLWMVMTPFAYAEPQQSVSMDRLQLVAQQIDLLKDRLTQEKSELVILQQEHDQDISHLTVEKANKKLLDRASLDISVARSNLDSISIELTDSQQTISWLEKNIQEIDNQLNILGIFGLKTSRNDVANVSALNAELSYQRKLLSLEKQRVGYVQSLKETAKSVLNFKKDRYDRLDTLLKSRNMVHLNQQQMKDELAYQQLQNQWLQQLNALHVKFNSIDPSQSQDEYANLEREIFYASERANLAYVQSLLARYRDQIQQLMLVVTHGNSISLLNEIHDQEETISKQVVRVDAVLNARITVLDKHIANLTPRKTKDVNVAEYLDKLQATLADYKRATVTLDSLNKHLTGLRASIDQSLQTELAKRQGFPSFGTKVLLDMGKEMLLLPALTFQVIKSLSANLARAFAATTTSMWTIFGFIEVMLVMLCAFIYQIISEQLERPSAWRDRINSKWLGLQWLKRHLVDLALFANIVGALFFFEVPSQNYMLIVYLALVWIIFKSILVLSRLCLIEAEHDDTSGHDTRLYYHLRWMVLLSAAITAFTVFVHQLPLIYELKMLCDRFFLFMMMIVSLLLLRSWRILPNLILSHAESPHPYLQRCIMIMGVLIPLLMLGNALIGLAGFVNLIMTVSWYEGVFLIVLIGYLSFRGLLTAAMEQLSRLMIQYVSNGWLYTEAFLKPIDKVLRITLFLTAGATLFLLYGWTSQSPMVLRINAILHYQLSNVFGSNITPIILIELFIIGSLFAWLAKWTREFVYRMLVSRTKDMGIRNSLAILSQYTVVLLSVFICLRVLGIDLRALAVVASMLAFGIGFGLRELASNFVSGFLILLERPLRVGDIVNVNGNEGEVTHIGGRAVTIKTWDYMDVVVPNTEIFNKSFINWTAKDNIVRTVVPIKISRHENVNEVITLVQQVLAAHANILKEPPPEVYLRDMSGASCMDLELRYFVNIRQVKSRISVTSSLLMAIWETFEKHGIRMPYQQQEIFIRGEPLLPLMKEVPSN